MINVNVVAIGSFLTSAGLIWAAIVKWIAKVKPIIKPMILDAEARAKDGTIDLEDRKAIVMTGINAAVTCGVLTLNIISRWIISRVVDKIAEALPDFKINASTGTPVPPDDDYHAPTMQ